MQICFATNNKHKLEEVKHLLGTKFQILSLQEIGCLDELAETQDTLEGNSLQKADFVFNKYQIPCFADDTGLEVDALQGAPGVYSARYAGEHKDSNDNINLLLKNLQGQTNRKAQFRTIITLKGFKQDHFFEGIIKGNITAERKGAGGFGYDPIFIPVGFNVTFAEMSMTEKNKLSHRAIAVDKLVKFLQASNY
jgi:XTP/dITP diphosphohydrolase